MLTNWKRMFGATAALVASVVLSTSAQAQTCPTATGPDVIVGDITGPQNYTANGSLEALSLGTTSCNLGNVWLNWFANTANKPVIGGALFRYKVVNGAGRFEQVGQSWLKHGFFALSQNLCCSNCVATDGAHLGTGCSDPYTAARNGSQSGLGPKWQVNAFTGVYTYPPANPAWSGSTARRLEVAIADLETTSPTGTRYFGEAVYVTPDDSAAGNNFNNASYREVTVTGSGTAWNFAFSGATQRQKPAIQAWKVVDPSVQINTINIPGEGQVRAGYKATSLGNGIWRYEYAIYNNNSDRSIGSFSVPVGAGVNVTNIGFRDVDYRNGDGPGNVNFSGTDWAGSVANGAVTWATTPFAQNASANAIRWGTLYNFRFDANAAPSQVSATLGTFKVVGNLNTTVDGPGGSTGPVSGAFCFGDGSGLACPCGNNSAVGANEGCLNSLGSGASLGFTGTASVANDSVVLTGSGMPDSSALYFQGTTQAGVGAGTAFGDGLRCAAGSILRLGLKVNSLGTSSYPSGADQSVSVRGAVPAGATRMYQVWYRNGAPFCTTSTFNLSNGFQIVWAP